MDYYFNKTVSGDFEEIINKVTDALKSEGFGVLTQIDVKDTFKKKLNVDFKNYRILGACNPKFAFAALQTEDKIGAMLPCNVIIIEQKPGQVEVAAVDPVASMLAVENKNLGAVATEVRGKLKKVIESI